MRERRVECGVPHELAEAGSVRARDVDREPGVSIGDRAAVARHSHGLEPTPARQERRQAGTIGAHAVPAGRAVAVAFEQDPISARTRRCPFRCGRRPPTDREGGERSRDQRRGDHPGEPDSGRGKPDRRCAPRRPGPHRFISGAERALQLSSNQVRLPRYAPTTAAPRAASRPRHELKSHCSRSSSPLRARGLRTDKFRPLDLALGKRRA